MKKTVIRMLHEAAKNFGNNDFVHEKDDSGYISKSFVEVNTDSDLMASGMLEMGLAKEDKVSILAEGRMDWVVSEFGIIKSGCIAVPLSIKLLPEEVVFRLNHSESKAVVLSYNTLPKVAPVWKEIENEGFKIIFIDKELGSLEKLCKENGIVPERDIVFFDDLLKNGSEKMNINRSKLDQIEQGISENDVVSISYTSGTTGNPKGIMLTHLNYYANSHDSADFFEVPLNAKLLIILPLDHSFAHTVGIYTSLVRSLSIYFIDARGGGMATVKNIPINMKEANADFMLTVPALTGNFMTKIKPWN